MRKAITALATSCWLLLGTAAAAQFTLTSPAFSEGASVPVRYTCDGQGESPPLHWHKPPAGTQSFALVVSDPDAPDPAHPTHTFVHWVVTYLPPSTRMLKAAAAATMPTGSRSGQNGAHHTGYVPLCPPIGRHHYFFRLFALDVKLSLPPNTTRRALLRALHGHVLGRAVLIGTYAHSR